MREAFVEALTEMAERGEAVYVLAADTGFHVLDRFRARFPERYLNVGISEAAMIGVAAGLAQERKRVFCYGIVPFVTMRCFEQIRVDLCYPCLPVTIVGVGGGLTYGPAGATHHAIEDVAVLSALPNMTIVCPGDPLETKAAAEACVSLTGPCYLRLGKSGEPVIHTDGIRSFRIGKGIRVREGSEIGILATGTMLETAVRAAELLEKEGRRPEVVSMHTLKPIDRPLITDLAGRCRTLVTVEEHSHIGGLGATVAGAIADLGLDVRFERFALPDAYAHEAGSQEYFRRKSGLTAEQIVSRVQGESHV